MSTNPNEFMRRTASGVAIALLLGATALPITLPTIKAYNKTVPNLAGTWQINREKSDDPRTSIGDAIWSHDGGLSGSRSSNGDGSPDGGGVPGRSPHVGDRADRRSPTTEQIKSMLAQLEEEMRAADVLEIIQTDSEITVNETGNDRLVRTQTFYTDGRKSKQDTTLGKLETNAKWRGNKFVVETKIEGEGKLTRTYELKSGGRELSIKLKIENERMPQAISMRSIYYKT